MRIKDFEHAMEIAKTIENGGVAENHPVVKIKCEAFWDTRDFSLIQEMLDDYPGCYEEAQRNIEEQTHWEEKEPHRVYYKEDKIDDLKGVIEIGRSIPGDATIGFNPIDLAQILAVYGVPKVGKTWLLILILRQIFRMKNRDFNVIVVDRKLDFIHLIKEFPRLFILGAEPNLFNILQEKEGWLEAVQVIADENYFGGTSQPMIEAAFQECMLKNGILKGDAFTDSENYPNYSELLNEIIDYAQKRKLSGRDMWDVISKIKTRLEQYIRMGSVFNCKTGFPLDFWLNNDIIINPRGMSRAALRCFIVGLSHRIYRHFRDSNMRGDRLRTLFILDEGGWLFDAERDSKQYTTNEALNDLLRMGREFGIGWIISAQQPNMICKTVRQNAQFLISFRVQSNSMDEVQMDFGIHNEMKDYIKHKLPPKLVGIFSTPYYPGPVMFRIPEGE